MSLVNNAQLYIDASGYEKISQPIGELGVRMLGLDHFNITGTLIRRRREVKRPQDWIRRKIRKYRDQLVRTAEQRKPYYLRREVVEAAGSHFTWDRQVYDRAITGDVTFYGYWQTEKYFADIEEVLRRDLVVRDALDGLNQELAQTIRSVNSVSVHVRHGDNATAVAAAYGVLPEEYFRTAISRIVQQVSNPQFFVFSDDIPWAKEALVPGYPTTFVAHNGDAKNYEDLRLMSFCRHHIVGNSTFSWWGAWLGKKDGQIVYAPQRYYQNIDRPNPDLYPVSWRLV
jgi:hypothetical protein